jgi:2-iminobutanoate/2-iminopropanoate deaminase
MKHESVIGENLPAPIGPYSPAVTFERLIFVSGQGATVPETGELAGPDVATQTEQVFKNMERILKAAGSSLQHVLRCGVFIVDMRDFGEMNAVYERMMAGNKPARTTVQVTSLPLVGLRVEIDAIAYVP